MIICALQLKILFILYLFTRCNDNDFNTNMLNVNNIRKEIVTYRMQNVKMNCGNIEDLKNLVKKIDKDLRSNMNYYIANKEYFGYFYDIIEVVYSNLQEDKEYISAVSQLVNYIFEMSLSNDITIISKLLEFIDLLSDKFMNMHFDEEMLDQIKSNKIVKGMTLLHYPYSRPYTTQLFDLDERLAIRKNYRIFNNLKDTINCEENKDIYLVKCQNNEIAYIDHIRSIYYINDKEAHFMALFKLYVIYLNFSIAPFQMPIGIYNYENTFINLESLLLNYDSINNIVVKKCILWIILDRLVVYNDNPNERLSILITLRSINMNNTLKLLVYDYIIAIKEFKVIIQKNILNILFEYIKILTTKYKLIYENINTLLKSFDYICIAHEGKIFIEIDTLLRVKFGMNLMQMVFFNPQLIKIENKSKLNYIMKIKHGNYSESLVKTAEITCIKHFNNIIFQYKKSLYNEMKSSTNYLKESILLLFILYDNQRCNTNLIVNFLKYLISYKINACIEILFATKYNTSIEECIFYLCMLLYDICYYKTTSYEKIQYERLLYVVICKDNPIVGDILYKNSHFLRITDQLLKEKNYIPAKINLYFQKNKLNPNIINHQNVYINSDDVIESTRKHFYDVKNIRHIKWKITFSNKSHEGNIDNIRTWLDLFVKELKNSDLNLFQNVKGTTYFYPSLRINSSKEILTYYELTGILIGIGLSNNRNFKLELSPIVYKYILNLNCEYSDFVEDNAYILKAFENIDILESKNTCFTIRILDNNRFVDMELMVNGRNTLLSQNNIKYCLHLLSIVYLETGVKDQIKSIINGMKKIINLKQLNGLSEKGLKRLIFGYESFSSNKILSMIRYDDKITDLEKSYMYTFINEYKIDDINKMVRIIVGDELMEEGKYIYIIKTKDLIIRCGFKSLTLEIPNFCNYENFKAQMLRFINHYY
ncbi:E3 ubiquitin-protein ligase ptr1 [Astathelohania contejeani]|uniref:E3 ubiquitin-protein ligase ptr1 n=1 Tax=Astathelohania contejeani TaxID=164912 RepID=A0ABQ7I208_9MICR|nr:E3 ubiquitin-protein ligase ptr1 [Thelohania contejeani]